MQERAASRPENDVSYEETEGTNRTAIRKANGESYEKKLVRIESAFTTNFRERASVTAAHLFKETRHSI